MLDIKIISTGSVGNCYLLNCNTKTFILDAGISTIEIKKALGFDIRRISGVFISHAHQ